MNKFLSVLLFLYGAVVMIGLHNIWSFFSGMLMFMIGAVSFMILVTTPKLVLEDSEKKSHAFFKIVETIASCTKYEHLSACRTMIWNYEKMYRKEFPDILKEGWELMELVRKKNWELTRNYANL